MSTLSYYHDSIFMDAVEESTAQALNVLSTAIVEGIHVEVIFSQEDYTSISYTVKMPTLLEDAKNSVFHADGVRKVMNALRVLFKPMSERWTRYTVSDEERGNKMRIRTIHLGAGKGSKVVYVNLWY